MEAHDVATPAGTLHLRRVNGGGHVPTLFLHGSTLPASVALATPLDGASYLDLHAAAGRDAWCLDFRGFGRSFRPAGTGPVTFTPDAVDDLSAAVDHVLAATGAAAIDLVGWSWGSTVAATFATRGDARLRRLALLAPQWLRDTPSPLLKNPAVMAHAYRTVGADTVAERWVGSLPSAVAQVVAVKGWDAALKAALADPAAGAGEAPNGPLVEIAERWSAGRPVYDPKAIGVPVRIIVGADDPETPPRTVRKLFAELADHPDAQYLEIAGATHFVPLEPKRTAVVDFVAAYLG
ncbi:alpha/beta fold hydrolase [Acuticoccus mangrovi]|uniref:Alpha/beta hydrolase n=1 Tax=Acuticoccus mangrovi TaxID=2796142 RepID=A0A934IP75_9HYPH|nr:alpha/beta hydrolase [Acuticoccus mangrovi]MBJ3776106.1 alpha/beta hydrolase [Acuticoccus mangrovi]